jgi:hypothetical protein
MDKRMAKFGWKGILKKQGTCCFKGKGKPLQHSEGKILDNCNTSQRKGNGGK